MFPPYLTQSGKVGRLFDIWTVAIILRYWGFIEKNVIKSKSCLLYLTFLSKKSIIQP
jgi:hypothetical protein